MSDFITSETLHEQQEIIEFNQQEFKDNFKYKLFKNLKSLYIVFDYNPNGLETDTKIETVFESINPNFEILKTNSFVFEQIKEMTMFENEIISYLNDYTDTIDKIYLINYSEELEYLIDYTLFKKITDSSLNIEIDLKQCSIDLESNGNISLSTFKMISGHFLVDKSFILQAVNIDINTININSYNDKYADSSFNLYTEKSVTINNIKLYSSSKLNIICENKNGETYMEGELNINYCNVYGKETVKNDLNRPRITIKGFYKCYLDVIEIEEDVSYGTIIQLDLLDYVFIGNINRDIKNILDGDTIVIKNISKLTIGEAHINVNEESDISNNTSFINFYGTPDANIKILLNNINIQNNSDMLLTFFKISGESITKFTATNITINKNISLFDVSNTNSNILKANISFLNMNDGDSLSISNCEMLTISNCILSLNDISLYTKQMNIIDCEFKANTISFQHDYMTKFTTNNTSFTSKNLNIINNNSEVQPKTYIKNSRFFISDNFIIENVIPSITNTLLNISHLEISNDTFVKCNEVIIQPYTDTILFDIYTSITGYLILSTVENFAINFNIQDPNKSFVTNFIEMSSNDGSIKGRYIDIKTNYPLSYTSDNCNTNTIDIELIESEDLTNGVSIFKTTLPNQKIILDSNKKYDLITIPSEEGSDYTTYSTKNK